MFPALIGIVLSCQLTDMMPDNYKAEITSLKAKDTFSMVLTYQYYGANFDYKYTLKNSELGLVGKDKRGDEVLVHNLKKTKENYTLVINSQKEGELNMKCAAKK
jgi:hypothetical protein